MQSLRLPEPHVETSSKFQDLLREHLENDELELPALNTTVVRLLALCSSENYDCKEVGALLATDQSLAIHLLRVSNSCFSSPLQPIKTLTEAVSRLGAQSIGEVAIALSLRGEVFRQNARHPRFVQEMWQHSAVSGVYAQNIGALLRRPDGPGPSMLAGLLHDVGRPVIFRTLLDVERLADEHLTAESMEYLMSSLHCSIGSLLLREWHMSPELQAAAEFHHDYTQAQEFRESAMVAHLADVLAHWALEPQVRGGQDLNELQVVRDLGLRKDSLAYLFARRDKVLEIAAAFG